MAPVKSGSVEFSLIQIRFQKTHRVRSAQVSFLNPTDSASGAPLPAPQSTASALIKGLLAFFSIKVGEPGGFSKGPWSVCTQNGYRDGLSRGLLPGHLQHDMEKSHPGFLCCSWFLS